MAAVAWSPPNLALSWPSAGMRSISSPTRNRIRLTGPHPNIHYHEVEVSRYPLFDYPPYDLALATRMAEVSELYDLDLLHVHYAIPHSVSALLARQMLAAAENPAACPLSPLFTEPTSLSLDSTVLSPDHALLHRGE